MNCNKCGTPILPGEHTCRFCGAVDDFSVRTKVEPKPEIIDFNINEEVEVVDFMIGEDEVSINPEPNKQPINNDEIIDFSFDEAPVQPQKEENVVSVVNSVIEEPATARIPVEEVKQLLEQQPEKSLEDIPNTETIFEPISEEKIEETTNNTELVEEPIVKQKVEEPIHNEEPKKEKKSSSKIGFIVVTMLLILSVILNCFLLMGRASTPEVSSNEVSEVSLTSVYNNYEIKLPNNWDVNSTSDEFLLIYDGSEDWAASINFKTGLDYSLIKDNISTITDEFGNNKYLFTSDYTKTINNKEFYVFKGKYYEYTVYVILNQIGEDTIAVTDLKFVGEVEDTILNSLLDSLTTISVKDMSNFMKDNFEFNDISNVLTNVIAKEN